MNGDATRNPDGGTELKRVLREKHWNSHPVFRREYNKAAKKVDRDLVGLAPGKAQFYKWLSGDLKGLPHADHCAVLEAMLPGYTVDELFSPAALPQRVQESGQHLPRPDDRQQVVHSEPPEPSDSRGPNVSPDAAGVRDRTLRALRISARAGVPNGSPDSVVGSGEPRDQREVTAAIDDRLRSLMSWIGETAPIKERDLYAGLSAPVRPAVDRRRTR
ncbi:hypothetical protein [Nocardia sp. NPDC004123]